MRGEEGVELFYDESRIRRHGAMPAFIQESLFGHASVHSLDGAEHRHRKATFVDVLYDDAEVQRLLPELDGQWQRELDAWVAGGQRSAYDAAVGALGRSIMRWAGIPGTASAQTAGRSARRRSSTASASPTPRVRARAHQPPVVRPSRCRAHRRGTRRHPAPRREHGPARVGAPPRRGRRTPLREDRGDRAAEQLPAHDRRLAFRRLRRERTARPPEWRERIAAETTERGTLVGGELAMAFAQEIRRTAPFVPMLPAWAETDIELDGQRVPAGGRVVLDILGTDTDTASGSVPPISPPSASSASTTTRRSARSSPTAAPTSAPATAAPERSSRSPGSRHPSPSSATRASASAAAGSR